MTYRYDGPSWRGLPAREEIPSTRQREAGAHWSLALSFRAFLSTLLGPFAVAYRFQRFIKRQIRLAKFPQTIYDFLIIPKHMTNHHQTVRNHVAGAAARWVCEVDCSRAIAGLSTGVINTNKFQPTEVLLDATNAYLRLYRAVGD